MNEEWLCAALFSVIRKAATCNDAADILSTFIDGVNSLGVSARLRVLQSHHLPEGEVVFLRAKEGSYGRLDLFFGDPAGAEAAKLRPLLAQSVALTAQILESRHTLSKVKLWKPNEPGPQAVPKAAGPLTGSVTHDLGSNLDIIMSHAETATEGVPQRKSERSPFQEARLGALRAVDVVPQWIDCDRQVESPMEPITLHSIVRDTLPLLRAGLSSNIEIQTDLPENCRSIMADPNQIRRLLMHLVANAAQPMEGRAGLIAINLAEIEVDEGIAVRYPDLKPGNYLRLSVADNGRGIASKTKAHTLNPYFTPQDAGKGAAKGLALAQEIVRSHKGVMSIYSEVGHGTTLRVLFPFARPWESRQHRGGIPIPTGFEKILFIDDEPALAEMGRNQLRRLGYHVFAETDPMEALEFLRTDPMRVDLVITDLTMPGMSGTQLAREIRRRYPRIPVILCTGFSEKHNRNTFLQLGLSAYLEKPVDRRELAAAVRKALDGR
jgi:signal transduction histidine kinase